MKKRFVVFAMLGCLLALCAVVLADASVTLPTPSLFGIDPNILTVGLGLLTTLLTALFNKRKYSTNETYLITYGVCAVIATIGGLVTKNITGATLSGGQWFAAFLMVAGAANGIYAIMRVKLKLARDGFNGGDISLPTTKKELIEDAESALKYALSEYGLPALLGKVADLAKDKVSFTGTLQAGIAGAVPAPDTAPLVGGTKLTATPSTGLAAVVQDNAGYLHSSTGESFVNDNAVLPTVPLPTITPSPGTQAEMQAITDAIASGTPVGDVVGEQRAPGGSE